jgi:hypothetical protein
MQPPRGLANPYPAPGQGRVRQGHADARGGPDRVRRHRAAALEDPGARGRHAGRAVRRLWLLRQLHHGGRRRRCGAGGRPQQHAAWAAGAWPHRRAPPRPDPPPLSQPRPGGEPPPAHPSPAACPARRSARWPTDPEAPPTPTPHTHTHPTHTCPAPPQILAGEEIDATFGVSLGLTTMAAAGLGNLFADVAGISIANSIEVGRAGRALQARGRGQGAALARLRLGASAAPKPRPSLPPPACRSKTCGGSGTSGTRWCPRARAAPPRSRVSRAGRAGPLPQPGRAGRRLATMRLAVPGPLGPLGQCSCRRRPAGLPACPGRHLPCSPDM